MSFFARLPLAYKLVLTMMATSTVALLVACVFLLSYDARSVRNEAADHLQGLAEITGANVTAALTYKDPKSAELVLRSLKAEPHIVAARIYDGNGKVFASYRRADSGQSYNLPEDAPLRGTRMGAGDVTECADVMLEGERIGLVFLISDLREIEQRAQRFVWFVVILMCASSSAAFLVAVQLKRIISEPILDLLGLTKTVSRDRNFAIRARVTSKDEMGVLVESFNEMLAEIELAQDALRSAHAESELFINAVPSILIGTDNEGLVTRWNLAAASVFRIPADAILNQPLRNCGAHWIDPDLNREIDSWFRVERLERRENVMFERDGRRRFLGLTIINVDRFTGSKDAGFLITGADVTEKRVLEGQLQQAQKLEAIGQLAAGIAHEINTPCQYVGDNARYLQQTWPQVDAILERCLRLQEQSKAAPVPPETLSDLFRLLQETDIASVLTEAPEAIAEALEGVERVSKIVRAMKEFSHPGSEDISAIDINHAIETTIAVARNEWKYVADVQTHLAPNFPPVPCFAGEFNQVILNLLINAAHAIADVVGKDSGRKGTITVTTKYDDEWAEVRVHDTGTGVPENIRARIFEPFFTTKPIGKGTGQGLALAHSVIVKKHNGRIWFESDPGAGTTFFVRLPLKVDAKAAFGGNPA